MYDFVPTVFFVVVHPFGEVELHERGEISSHFYLRP
jgi:hypothetical protein